MSVAKRIATAAALIGTILTGALAVAGPASASEAGPIIVQGTCGQTFDVDVSGGAAGWTLSCSGGNIRAIGWVKDTDADGKAAEVYGTWQNGDSFGVVRAGGEGTLTHFDKQHSGSNVYLYLRVI
jgi:hypothetical protein